MENNKCEKCKEIIELSVKVGEIYRIIDELRTDKRIQDAAIKHSDGIINDIRSSYQAMRDGLVRVVKNMNKIIEDLKDYPIVKTKIFDMEKERINDKKTSSQKNWALWLVLIGTIVSSLSVLMINLLKEG